ncbi:MAG TPA: BON domain-containing protein [Caulifigura sp.]|nr:BON domain-containing protein [Caulifigura sp.]
MRLPRKWVLSMALLATAPGYVVAGPADSTGAPAAAASSNQAMANKIATALKSAQIKGKGVQLQFDKGVCTITGEALDAQQKALATQVISSVPGVTSCNNQLSVAARPMPPVTTAGYEGASRQPVRQVSGEEAAPPANNQQTAQAIAEALSASGLAKYDIEVRFSGGVCTLGGECGSPDAAMKAEQAARSVPGVQQVSNRITCQGRPAAQAARPQAPVMPAGYPQTAMAPQGMPPQGMPPGMDPRMGMPPGMGMAMSPQQMQQMGLRQASAQMPVPMAAQQGPGVIPAGGHMVYNQPNVPEYAWPSYAAYDNTAAVTYPGQYDASAFPYIGPYYPYPQVPLGWRKSTLEWKDGSWNLKFSSRTDRWWWFMNPHNWSE